MVFCKKVTIVDFAITLFVFCKYFKQEITRFTLSEFLNNKPSLEITDMPDEDKYSATKETLFLLLHSIVISLNEYTFVVVNLMI